MAAPAGVDGVSVLPTLLGKAQPLERDLFWTRKEGNLRYLGQSIWAIRSGGSSRAYSSMDSIL